MATNLQPLITAPGIFTNANIFFNYLNGLQNADEYLRLKALTINGDNTLNVIGKGTSETVYSSIIANILRDTALNKLQLSPIYLLLRQVAHNFYKYGQSSNPNIPREIYDSLLLGCDKFSDIEVKTEEPAGNNGRMDIFIKCNFDCQSGTTNDLVICIENKVGSKESPGQCLKYEKYIKQKYPNAKHLFIFLCVNKPASLSSNEFVILTYTELLNNVLTTLKLQCDCQIDNIIPQSYTLLSNFINTLQQEYLDSNPTGKIAISNEYYQLINWFWENISPVIMHVRDIQLNEWYSIKASTSIDALYRKYWDVNMNFIEYIVNLIIGIIFDNPQWESQEQVLSVAKFKDLQDLLRIHAFYNKYYFLPNSNKKPLYSIEINNQYFIVSQHNNVVKKVIEELARQKTSMDLINIFSIPGFPTPGVNPLGTGNRKVNIDPIQCTDGKDIYFTNQLNGDKFSNGKLVKDNMSVFKNTVNGLNLGINIKDLSID
jgi:hypothetical protein